MPWRFWRFETCGRICEVTKMRFCVIGMVGVPFDACVTCIVRKFCAVTMNWDEQKMCSLETTKIKSSEKRLWLNKSIGLLPSSPPTHMCVATPKMWSEFVPSFHSRNCRGPLLLEKDFSRFYLHFATYERNHSTHYSRWAATWNVVSMSTHKMYSVISLCANNQSEVTEITLNLVIYSKICVKSSVAICF